MDGSMKSRLTLDEVLDLMRGGCSVGELERRISDEDFDLKRHWLDVYRGTKGCSGEMEVRRWLRGRLEEVNEHKRYWIFNLIKIIPDILSVIKINSSYPVLQPKMNH